MNRKEEYQNLIQELEAAAPGLQRSVDKARKRRARTRIFYRPLASAAAVFMMFVVLVNFSAPVAYACSWLPILRELADAVTFSRSLTDAVENEYAQIVDQEQTENGITASVEYLIVDRKQVHIFFRMDSFWHSQLSADAMVEWEIPYKPINDGPIDGKRMRMCDWMNFSKLDNGLYMLKLDCFTENIPSRIDLTLQVYEGGSQEGEYFWEWDEAEREYLAELRFNLKFDPKFTAPGKIIQLDQPLEMEGQRFTLTNVEVYPTCMYVSMIEDVDNTMKLQNLNFYIESSSGMQFHQSYCGAVTRHIDSGGDVLTFEADSMYFYDADSLNLVITGATWKETQEQTFSVDLVTGEADSLPDGLELQGVEKQDGDYLLTFHTAIEQDSVRHIYGQTYKDPEGGEYTLQWTSAYGEPDEAGEVTYMVDVLRLRDYHYEQVWLANQYRKKWLPEEPIVITVQ